MRPSSLDELIDPFGSNAAVHPNLLIALREFVVPVGLMRGRHVWNPDNASTPVAPSFADPMNEEVSVRIDLRRTDIGIKFEIGFRIEIARHLTRPTVAVMCGARG